jgi:diguanylate cyclase (GGDEF)-like protein
VNRVRLGGAGRVWLLSALLALLAIPLFAIVRGMDAPLAGPRLTWLVLAGIFALAEIFVVHLRFGRDAHGFSMSEIPIVVGLFFWAPSEIVLAQLLGGGLVLTLLRRQPPLKVAFNLAQWAAATTTAVMIFRAIAATGDVIGPAGWVAAFAATLYIDLFAGFMINVAISVSEGTRPQFPHMGVGTGAVFANTCLALVAVTVLWWQPEAAWLLVSLFAIVFVAYRAYGSVTQKHESMRLLYESTRIAQESMDVDSMLLGLLSHARDMFRAELAEIDVFVPGEEGVALRTAMTPDRTDVMTAVSLDPRRGVWARVASEGEALLLPRPIENKSLREYFAELSINDVMVTPIRGSSGVVGTILVGNRIGDFSTFNAEDLELLETLANHLGVSLENGRLIDRLRQKAQENEHLAMHDALTGLPNRVLFRNQVHDAIEAARSNDSYAAVMLMDLDRFKEVNDTLGHHNGDLLLTEVGNRLRKAIRQSDGVARLGGDEFAILLPEISEPDAARRVALKVLQALERPLHLEDLTLDIGASIGIAVYPRHGGDADTLLQRADVAMYVAKETNMGAELYSHDKDGYSPDRLGLVAELRSAIDQHELHLVFQPKVDLQHGGITGFEALIRWDHPRRGFLPPDEFIPIAEHTGLIMPLTNFVVDKALEECRRWMDSGHAHRVSVNLSARTLLNAHLPEQIERALARWSVSPEYLQLEITESSLMVDPERSGEILQRLSDMGVGLSIDDYGSGYSSLSHLRRLPVSEVKIDKSFVLEMTSEANDAAIVRSTIELGHILGMRVVAEGVETAAIFDRLAALGCDEAQGYHIARPLPAEQIPAWLTEFDSAQWVDPEPAPNNVVRLAVGRSD